MKSDVLFQVLSIKLICNLLELRPGNFTFSSKVKLLNLFHT